MRSQLRFGDHLVLFVTGPCQADDTAPKNLEPEGKIGPTGLRKICRDFSGFNS
jgi:hypothetical protein